jgi:hypothetical protein
MPGHRCLRCGSKREALGREAASRSVSSAPVPAANLRPLNQVRSLTTPSAPDGCDITPAARLFPGVSVQQLAALLPAHPVMETFGTHGLTEYGLTEYRTPCILNKFGCTRGFLCLRPTRSQHRTTKSDPEERAGKRRSSRPSPRMRVVECMQSSAQAESSTA